MLKRGTPTFTTFDAPGAGTGPGQGTFPNAINPVGAIGGDYLDASNLNHSFLRAAVVCDRSPPLTSRHLRQSWPRGGGAGPQQHVFGNGSACGGVLEQTYTEEHH